VGGTIHKPGVTEKLEGFPSRGATEETSQTGGIGRDPDLTIRGLTEGRAQKARGLGKKDV